MSSSHLTNIPRLPTSPKYHGLHESCILFTLIRANNTLRQLNGCYFKVFLPGEVKCLMIQLLRAIAHLHDNWILHRDLKASNLLLSHKGMCSNDFLM